MDYVDFKSEFVDHGFDDISDTRLVNLLNDTMWDICSREPWPFLQKLVRLTFTGISYECVTFPTDFNAVTSMKIENSTAPPLVHVRQDGYEEAFGDNTIVATGVPSLYYIDAATNAVHFYPAPSATTVIRMGYVSTPAATTNLSVAANYVIPIQFHRAVLLNGALFKAYAMNDDQATAPIFETFYERGLANMREWIWRKDYTRPDIIHPIDPDDIGMEIGLGFWAGGSL